MLGNEAPDAGELGAPEGRTSSLAFSVHFKRVSSGGVDPRRGPPLLGRVSYPAEAYPPFSGRRRATGLGRIWAGCRQGKSWHYGDGASKAQRDLRRLDAGFALWPGLDLCQRAIK